MESINVVIPKRVENLQLPDPDLLRMYEDEEERRIYLEGPIGTEDDPTNENSIGIIKRILAYNRQDIGILPKDRKEVKLFIDSPGGDSISGGVLQEVILLSKTPIHTINMCTAYSMSGLLLCCGHRRSALRGSSVLIHSGSTFVGGTKEQADSVKKFFDKNDKRLCEILFQKTKIDPKTYRSKAPKDWYLDAEDCLKYGIVDEIVEDLDSIL